MRDKLVAISLSFMLILAMVGFPASAEAAPPADISAPEHFGAGHYLGDNFNLTVSLPDELRAYMDAQRKNFVIHAQIDYMIEGGDWHYTSAWDTAKLSLKNTAYFGYVFNEWYTSSVRFKLGSAFPEDTANAKLFNDNGWNLPDKAISFRVRFVESFDGGKTYLYSPWSNTHVLSMNVKADPDALINHAPELISAEVKKNTGGQPILYIKTGKQPGEVLDLNAMVSSGMHTEIWLKKVGDPDFKLVGTNFLRNEYMSVDVTRYFDKALQSYDAASYQIKIRYVLNDLRKYPQAGRSEIIYSPFSNVISHNMPEWSGASKWATAELKKAADAGLIPVSLKGADLTKPITREEFAELAVLLYEKITSKSAAAASENPFTDTENPEILKAYQLGITRGTSATIFAPKDLTNREQVATMLSRATRVMVPSGDFSITGAPTFSDQRDISSWALEHVKFMSKMGIIKGADGKFMPKATTTAEQASGYATTTREQAIAMGVRIFEQYKP